MTQKVPPFSVLSGFCTITMNICLKINCKQANSRISRVIPGLLGGILSAEILE